MPNAGRGRISAAVSGMLPSDIRGGLPPWTGLWERMNKNEKQGLTEVWSQLMEYVLTQ